MPLTDPTSRRKAKPADRPYKLSDEKGLPFLLNVLTLWAQPAITPSFSCGAQHVPEARP